MTTISAAAGGHSTRAQRATSITRPETLAVRDAARVAVGIASFGLSLGVTISALGFGAFPGLLGAAIVYGGSAQLTAVTLVQQGVALISVVVSASVVNSRLLLYSASLSWRFREQPGWFRWLAPHFLIDQTYLLAAARNDIEQGPFRRYWCWLGSSVLLVWTSSIAVGLLVAPLLPAMPHLAFVGTALFLGMLAPRLTTRPAVAAAVAAALVGGAVSVVRPEIGIICGAVAGVAAGAATQR